MHLPPCWLRQLQNYAVAEHASLLPAQSYRVPPEGFALLAASLFLLPELDFQSRCVLRRAVCGEGVSLVFGLFSFLIF